MQTLKIFLLTLFLSTPAISKELTNIKTLPSEILGSHILKSTFKNSKTKETPKSKKIFCKITNSEVKVKNKIKRIEKISKLTEKNITTYFLFFKNEKNLWRILKGQKVEHVIIEQHRDGDIKVVYGVDKK